MFEKYTVGKVQRSNWEPSAKIFFVTIVFWPNETEPVVVNVIGTNFQVWVYSFGGRFNYVVSHVRVTNEHSSLRSKSWIVLDGVCLTGGLFNHEIDGVDTGDLGQLSEVMDPFLDLVVVNAEPVELRGCGNGVGIDLDISIFENCGTRVLISLNKSLNLPWFLFGDWVSVSSNFFEVF